MAQRTATLRVGLRDRRARSRSTAISEHSRPAHFDALLLDGSSSLLDARSWTTAPTIRSRLLRSTALRTTPTAASALGSRLSASPWSTRPRSTTCSSPSAGSGPSTEHVGPLGISDATPRCPRNRGQVIAVGGPGGSGTTEVAVGLATAASAEGPDHPGRRRRDPTQRGPPTRADADASHRQCRGRPEPSCAERRPDVLDTRIAAVMAASGRGQPQGASLRRDRRASHGAEWPVCNPSESTGYLVVLRRRYATIILRLGPSLEDLSRWIDRFGVSRLGAPKPTGWSRSPTAPPPEWPRASTGWPSCARSPRHRSTSSSIGRPPVGFRRAELTEVLEAAVGTRCRQRHSVRFDKTLPERSWFGDLPAKGIALQGHRRRSPARSSPAPASVPPPPAPGQAVRRRGPVRGTASPAEDIDPDDAAVT